MVDILLKDGVIYAKTDDKILKIISEDNLKKMFKKPGYSEKVHELSMKYMDTIAEEIEKMGLDEDEQIITDVMIIRKLNRSVDNALERMVDDISDNYNEKEILQEYSAVLNNIADKARECIELQMSLFETLSYYNKPTEKRQEYLLSEMLYQICKEGKGKILNKYMDRVMTLCTEETNRLRRQLTKEEVIEICEDIKFNRK